ncbi:MAG: sodium:proton antiporter [Alicyclobacillaceae bacterium]|nr:sodium:proton antiporter [Alicyclobacillaceae bacterium]
MLHLNTWQGAWAALLLMFVGGLVVVKLTERPRIPDVAAYLLVGILLGPAALNVLSEPASSQVNQLVVNLGAVLLLFEGGRGVRLAVFRNVWLTVVLLATLGVLVSAVVVGVAAHLLLGGGWAFALLLSSVLAATDPATLIPVFQRVPIVERLEQTVASESAFNDATGAVLVFTVLGMVAQPGHLNVVHAVEVFFRSSLVGLAVGVSVGLLAQWLVSENGWGALAEYASIVMLVVAMGAFAAASALGDSGFMAAFAAGVVSGNGTYFGWTLAPDTEHDVEHFIGAITLIFRTLIFMLLGTQVDFVVVRQHLWAGLAVVAVLMFAARPLTVFACACADRKAQWRWRELLFMCWVRETGVIPAALAAVLVAKRVPGADVISAVTFLAILVTILVQASTTGLVAKRLRLLREGTTPPAP